MPKASQIVEWHLLFKEVQKNPERKHDKCECFKIFISSGNDCRHTAVALGPMLMSISKKKNSNLK
jgi:hypothetical protein